MTALALVCGPMVAGVHCGVSGFVERANFKTDDEFHLLAYHYVAYEVRGVRFGRCDAAGTATTWGCRSRVPYATPLRHAVILHTRCAEK